MFLDIDKQNPTAPALKDDSGQTVTYGELASFCEEAAGLLPARTVAFCLCENTNGCAAMILGCLNAGVVPLLLSAGIDPELLSDLAGHYTPALWLMPESTAPACANSTKSNSPAHACADSAKPESTKALLPQGRTILTAYGFRAILTDTSAYPVHPDLALLMTTSGSTGSPKLVRCTLANLEANAYHVAQAFGWTAADIAMCHLPIQYTMGLNHLTSHLAAGALAVLTKHRPTAAKYWEILRNEHCTDICGVPFNYEVFLRLRIQRMQLPDLKTLASGGGKLTEEQFRTLAEYAEQTGRRFIATFGTTETNARMSMLDPEQATARTLSIGKAIPGGELFLLNESDRGPDESGSSLDASGKRPDTSGTEMTEPAAEGELCYRGPNVAMGYAACRDDLLLGDEWKGTFRTEDLARRDEDGYYYITGRKSRFLKLYGLRISLDQCEYLLESHFHRRFACTGTDERVDIFCEDEESAQSARAYMAQKTGIPVHSFYSHTIGGLPRTESGKTDYRTLKSMIADES